MYAASPKCQRVWRNGVGLPRQGFFVRDKLLFKTGFCSDRLCVPCPKARLEILKKRTTRPWRDTVDVTRQRRVCRSVATGVACGEISTTL